MFAFTTRMLSVVLVSRVIRFQGPILGSQSRICEKTGDSGPSRRLRSAEDSYPYQPLDQVVLAADVGEAALTTFE